MEEFVVFMFKGVGWELMGLEIVLFYDDLERYSSENFLRNKLNRC